MKSEFSHAGAQRHRECRCRGTSEIEMLLGVIVLITILLLTLGGVSLGLARLDTVEAAAYKALGNATTGSTPLYTDSEALPVVTTVADIRPGMPNRTHVAQTEKMVDVYVGANQSLPQKKVTAYSGAISPAWTFSAWPFVADSAATQAWFERWVPESHEELIQPLLLAPPWTP